MGYGRSQRPLMSTTNLARRHSGAGRRAGSIALEVVGAATTPLKLSLVLALPLAGAGGGHFVANRKCAEKRPAPEQNCTTKSADRPAKSVPLVAVR